MYSYAIITVDCSFGKYNLSSFQFFVQNGRGEDDFEVEPPDFDIEYVGANVR